MAQLGTQNAQSPDVKQFAQQMQTEHQQMDEQLTQTAQTMGVTLEGKDFQKQQKDATKDMEKLQSKTGKEFDKEFMSRMVKDHEKDVKEVKDAAQDAQKGKHTELASTLQAAQTQIQGHLDHAKQVQKSLDQGSRRAGAPGCLRHRLERGPGERHRLLRHGAPRAAPAATPAARLRAARRRVRVPRDQHGGAPGTSSEGSGMDKPSSDKK